MTSRGSWIAASVRARSLANARLGAGGIRSVLMASGRDGGVMIASESMYSELAESAGRAPVIQEHAIGEAILWRLRVLAGWVPPGGTLVLRSVAAFFEADNIVRRVRAIRADLADPIPPGGSDGTAAPRDYVLAGLDTCWSAASRARDEAGIRAALAASAWGDPGPLDPPSLSDTLTIAAWRRLASVAPAARGWARDAVALLVARLRIIERANPSDRQRALASALIGRGWATASDLDGLRASLAPSGRRPFDGMDAADHLWVAEAELVARIDADAHRLLRSSQPGPEVVLAASALLMVDGWRLRAALTAAGDPVAVTEVQDALA